MKILYQLKTSKITHILLFPSIYMGDYLRKYPYFVYFSKDILSFVFPKQYL